jgi:hypothetical protein
MPKKLSFYVTGGLCGITETMRGLSWYGSTVLCVSGGRVSDKSCKIGQLSPAPPPLPLSGLLLGGTNALGRGNTFSTDLIAASFLLLC